MRLERLELSGFKSFPDRADVRFDSGVTAIVGPNGCGKSNIVDAITWVLGEQSAKSLRGDRMEDVIFGGSDARKATAAAEVRLHLRGVVARPKQAATLPGLGAGAPAEGDAAAAGEPVEEPPISRDVEIGRRLYRSGESEYLIDGHAVRLRDVQDILMDVGVGVKGYAVIEQGKIGQILSSKPTDRRQLIEEAAGVTKFKSRRRQAELKLEAAQQNLTRVDDLVYELERQRAALKRQAGKARRYQRLRGELRRWEKLLFAQRYERLTETIRSQREALSAVREREQVAAAHLAEVESDLERVRIELTEAESQANGLRAEAHQRELENERRQQQITFDQQQAASLVQTVQEITGELGSLEARQGPAREEIETRRAAAQAANAERDAAGGTLRDEARTVEALETEIGTLDHDADAARRSATVNLQSTTTLQHTIERAEEGRQRIGGELGRLDVEAQDLRIEVERLTAERVQAEEALSTSQAALTETAAARQAADATLGSARIEREWRVRDARAQDTALTAGDARLRSLQQLEASRAAYGEAARLILGSPEAGVSHHGSVADHLEVEPGGERAVEAAFADLLQCVVVATAADADRGLAFVRERGLGRCGFLSVDRDAPAFEPRPAIDGAQAIDAVVRVVGPAPGVDPLGARRRVDRPGCRHRAAAVARGAGRGGHLDRGGLSRRPPRHGWHRRRQPRHPRQPARSPRAGRRPDRQADGARDAAGRDRRDSSDRSRRPPSVWPASTASATARTRPCCSTSCTSRDSARSSIGWPAARRSAATSGHATRKSGGSSTSAPTNPATRSPVSPASARSSRPVSRRRSRCSSPAATRSARPAAAPRRRRRGTPRWSSGPRRWSWR